jgi:site-specific DNA-cytosine methylase
LFERESVQRHSAKSGAAREEIASDVQGRVGAGCWWDVAETLIATDYKGPGHNRDHNFISQPFDHAIPLDLRNSQRDTQATTITMVNMQGSKSNACVATDGTSFTLNAMHGHDVHAVAHAFYSTGGTHGLNQQPEVCPAIKVGSSLGIPSPPAVVQCVAPTITAGNNPSRSPQSAEVTQQVAAVHAASMTVRRLTPRECERLQGFPDDYTLIPWRKKAAGDCPDGPRYKALGNSMAVNCMEWIGERIAAVEAGEDK